MRTAPQGHLKYLKSHKVRSQVIGAFVALLTFAIGCAEESGPEAVPDASAPKATVGHDNTFVILARRSATLGSGVVVHSGMVGVSESLATYPAPGSPCIVGMSRNGCYAGDAEEALVLNNVNNGTNAPSRFVADTIRVLDAARLSDVFYQTSLQTNPLAVIQRSSALTPAHFPLFPALPEMPASNAMGDLTESSPYYVTSYQCFGRGTWSLPIVVGPAATVELRDDCNITDGVSEHIQIGSIRTNAGSTLMITSAYEVRVRDLETDSAGATLYIDSPVFRARNVNIDESNALYLPAGTVHVRNLRSRGDLLTNGTTSTPTHVIVENRLEISGPTFVNTPSATRFFVHGHDGPDARDLPDEIAGTSEFPPRPYAVSLQSMSGNVMALPGNGASGGTIYIDSSRALTGAFFADHVIVGPGTELTNANGIAGTTGAFPGYLADDADNDGVADGVDGCPNDPNPTQADGDGDGDLDACDNCPNVGNPRQEADTPGGPGRACTQPPGVYCGNGIVESSNGEQCDDGFANHATNKPCNHQCALSGPRFTILPTDLRGPLGGSVSTSVMAVGASPLTYEWQREGVTIVGATSPNLLISSLNASKVGVYTCIARTPYGVAMASFHVGIPPIFTLQPTNQTVPAGGTATFTAAATSGTGANVVTYQWRRNGIAIPGATSASLVVSNVGFGDSGATYTVTATEPTGDITSAPATLTVVFDSGTGTESSPYAIDSCASLAGLGAFPTARFVLTRDIDCAGFDPLGDGTGFVPAGTVSAPFSGVLDGDGHVIRNLRVARSASASNVGLIGFATAAQIRDVGLEAANITGGSLVGGLVGEGTLVTIERVFVTGTVNGTDLVGGLAGRLQQSIVTDVSARALVTRTASGVASPVAGLVAGADVMGVYTHVLVAGTLSGHTPVATLGSTVSTAQRAVLSDCTVTGLACGGPNKTTAALSTPSTYTAEIPAWNIAATWGFRKSTMGLPSGYACLRWESGCGTEPFCGDGVRAEWPLPERELCDDGNAANDDGCSTACTPSAIIVDASDTLEFRPSSLTSHQSAAVDGLDVVLFVGMRDYGSSASIVGRRASEGGMFLDEEPFVIDSNLPTDESAAATVAGLPGGGFVVVWTAARNGTPDTVARIVRADGSLGREVLVNTARVGAQERPAVTVLEDSIVVAWTTRMHTNADPLGGIRARTFDHRLTPRSEEILVATSRADFEQDVTVASVGTTWMAAWVRKAEGVDAPTVVWRRFQGSTPLDEEDLEHEAGEHLDQPKLVAMPHSPSYDDAFVLVGRSSLMDPYGDVQFLVINAVNPGVFFYGPLAAVQGRDERQPLPAVGSVNSAFITYAYDTPPRGDIIELSNEPSPWLAPLRAMLEQGSEGAPSALATSDGYWITWTGTLAGMRDRGFLAYYVSRPEDGDRGCLDGQACGGPNVAKLLYDWDARSLVSTTGGLVTEWRDRVTGMKLVFPVNDRPAVNPANPALGDRPTITFAGGEFGETPVPVPLPDSATWAFVMEQSPGGIDVLFEGGDPNYLAQPGVPVIFREGTRWYAHVAPLGNAAGRNVIDNHAPLVMIAPFDPRISGAPLQGFYINGTDVGIASGASFSAPLGDRTWHVGGRKNEAQYLTGSVARIRVYSSALTPAEAQEEDQWLRAEYGMTVTPPVDGMCADGSPCGGPNAHRLLYDWDASALVAETGGAVTTWTDRVHGRTKFIFPAGQRPTRIASDRVLGNRPSLDFTGAQFGETEADVPISEQATWVFVAERTGTATHILLEGGDPHYQAMPGAPVVHLINSTWYSNIHAAGQTAGRHTSTEFANPFVLVTGFDVSGAASPPTTLYINGRSVGTPYGSVPAGRLLPRRWHIGGRKNEVQGWSGSVARIRVYSGVLSASEAAEETNWLREVYGMVATPAPANGICADGNACGGPSASNLLYDWDARTFVTESSGEVTEWRDRVGGRATFVFPSGRRPERLAEDPTYNDQPSISFDGAEIGETEGDVPLAQTGTWIFVADQRGSGVRMLFESIPNYSSAPGVPTFFLDNTTWKAWIASGAASAGLYDYADRTSFVMAASFDLGASGTPVTSWSMNGESIGTVFGTLPGGAALEARPWQIGGRRNGDLYWKGSIARIRVYDRVLTTAETAAEESWLRAEHGLIPQPVAPSTNCIDGTPCGGPNVNKLLYDFDPRYLVTESGGVVTDWADRVRGHTSFQFASGARPTRAAMHATLGNRPTVNFTGAQIGITPEDVPITGTATWVVVTEQPTSGGTRTFFLAGNSVSFVPPSWALTQVAGWWYASFNTRTEGFSRGFPSSATRSISILPIDPTVQNSPFPAWYFNNVNSGTSSGSSVARPLGNRQWHIGGYPGWGQYWTGSVARIRVYAGTFSASEAAAEDAWLRTEYGL